MATYKLPYLQAYNSDGKRFYYYRRARQRIRIEAEPGSDAFPGAYEAARKKWEAAPGMKAAPKPGAAAGTLTALILNYRASSDFKTRSPKTQRDYGRVLTEMEKRFGVVAVRSLTRAWVLRMRDEKQETPRMANYRAAIISKLLAYAVDREYRPDSPALRIKKLETGAGRRIWTASEIAAMTSPEAGDVALPVLLALHTAQRQGDVLRMLWSAYDGRAIRLRQGKTGAELVIHASAVLRAQLDTMERKGAVICLTESGRPWKEDHFRHRFSEVRANLKMPKDLHFHGTRHTAATRMAQQGASDAEIASMTGHKTRSMVARYTRQAAQERLSESVVVRVEKRAVNGESV